MPLPLSCHFAQPCTCPAHPATFPTILHSYTHFYNHWPLYSMRRHNIKHNITILPIHHHPLPSSISSTSTHNQHQINSPDPPFTPYSCLTTHYKLIFNILAGMGSLLPPPRWVPLLSMNLNPYLDCLIPTYFLIITSFFSSFPTTSTFPNYLHLTLIHKL